MFWIMSRGRMSWTSGSIVELPGLMFWKVQNECVDHSFIIFGEQNVTVLHDALGISKAESGNASSKLVLTSLKAAFAHKEESSVLANSYSV